MADQGEGYVSLTPTVVHDRRGTHTFRDQGYSPLWCAHVYRCDEHGCRTIGNTDESKYRANAQAKASEVRDGTNS